MKPFSTRTVTIKVLNAHLETKELTKARGMGTDDLRQQPLMRTATAAMATVVTVTIPVLILVLATTPRIVEQYPTPWISHTADSVRVTWGRSNLVWGTIGVVVSDGSNGVGWNNFTSSDLTSANPHTTWHYGSPHQLGHLDLWLNITDMNGDGLVGTGDHLDVMTGGGNFTSSTTYTLTLMDKSNSAGIMHWTFVGQ